MPTLLPGDDDYDDAIGGQLTGQVRTAGPATLALQMTTPTMIVHGLALMGWQWNCPTAITDRAAHDALGDAPGLFCWVDGLGNTDPMHSAVLYVGLGAGRGGVAARLPSTAPSFGDFNPSHAHTLRRRHAIAVAGTFTAPDDTPSGDTGTLPAFITDNYDPSVARIITAWQARYTPLACARLVAIRLTAHLGDTVALANSPQATLRATDAGADLCAAAIDAEMARLDTDAAP